MSTEWEVLAQQIVELEAQLADVTAERDEWKLAYAAQQQVVRDIGATLGANTPYELVNAVARRRMQELSDVTAERDHFQRALHLADMLRNKTEGKDNGK